MRAGLLILSIGICAVALADGGAVTVAPVNLPNLPLGLVTFPNGKALNLAVSPAAGAFRAAGDPEGRIWAITDRGPVIDCTDEKDVVGTDDKAICPADRRGKIYLLPGYAPSIYAIDVAPDNTARFSHFISLKGRAGRPVSGLTNPLTAARAEGSFAIDGRALDQDPSGIEPGGIVRLKDGSFWVADEFGPSLLEIGPEGEVRRRIVPESLGDDLKSAEYPIEPTLPSIMALRQVTRGFDGLAVSPDEKFLYVAMPNALVHPDAETYRRSPAVRFWKIERETARIVGAYLYTLEPAAGFRAETAFGDRPLRQSDVRVSEIVAVGPDRLLVLERVRNSSKIFLVDLSGATPLPARFDDVATRPTLEQLDPAERPAAGVAPLLKQQLADSDALKGLGGRLSAMAVLSPRELLVLSNNVYGADGGRSLMFRLTFAAPVLK